MGAKRSSEVKLALKLVAQGIPYKEAANAAGIAWRYLYKLLPKKKNAKRI